MSNGQLSEWADKIWGLLWEYIADENTCEPYSEKMAETLCEDVLPQVWDEILMLEKENDQLTRAEALALDVMHIKAWVQSNLDPLNKQQIIEAIARICDDALAAYREET